MPFTEKPAKHFPISPDDRIWKDFWEEQWTFCPAEFKVTTELELEPQHILPIVEKVHVSSGGSAEIHHIWVHPDYNGLTDNEIRNDFVLKTYHRGSRSESQYRKEISAFTTLRQRTNPISQHSLIGFYGSYEHDNAFNIIHEFINQGTLEYMFQNEAPPANDQDIKEFWFELLGILETLADIHAVRTKDIAGIERLYG